MVVSITPYGLTVGSELLKYVHHTALDEHGMRLIADCGCSGAAAEQSMTT